MRNKVLLLGTITKYIPSIGSLLITVVLSALTAAVSTSTTLIVSETSLLVSITVSIIIIGCCTTTSS